MLAEVSVAKVVMVVLVVLVLVLLTEPSVILAERTATKTNGAAERQNIEMSD